MNASRILTVVVALAGIGWLPATCLARAAFVGNNVIDLEWENTGQTCTYHLIRRNGVDIERVYDPAATFYRDHGVTKGQTYTYQHCWVLEREPLEPLVSCAGMETYTAGDVRGTIYEDLTWTSGVYTLRSSGVQVWEGAALTIYPGVTVHGSIYSRGNDAGGENAYPGGDIRIDGATLQEGKFIFSSPGDNWIKNSTLTGAVELRGSTEVLISHNPQLSVQMHVGGTANAIIVNENVFHNSEILLQYFVGGEPAEEAHPHALIKRNKFSADLSVFTVIQVSNGTATIAENVFEGQGRWPDAIAFGNATVSGNIIKGFRYAITLSGASGSLTGNTLIDNGFDIYLTGPTSTGIHSNCIASQYGLNANLAETAAVNATGNWWGSAWGPTHPNNPGGTGAWIGGENVDFSGWLQTSNCLEELPPVEVEPANLFVCAHTPAGGTASSAFVCQADPKIIPNGKATTELNAYVTDDQGAPLPGAEVTFSAPADLGGLLADRCTTASDGACSVTFLAPTPEQAFQGGKGVAKVTIQATAGTRSRTLDIELAYLQVKRTTPAKDTRNWNWTLVNSPAVVFDRNVDEDTVERSFEVRSERYYRDGMPCEYLTIGPQVRCEVELEDRDAHPDAAKGLVVTARLEAGPEGVRGEDGAMLSEPYEWKFYTLPKLSPRIIPVQVSEGTDVLDAYKDTVVRVHAGLDKDTELDWIEAKVMLEYDHSETMRFTRDEHRFYPGELGGPNAPRQFKLKGNSANFRGSKNAKNNEVPILDTGGAHSISANVEPLRQKPDPGDSPYVAPADETQVVVTVSLKPTGVTFLAIAPAESDPDYPWGPETVVILSTKGFLAGQQSADTLWPGGIHAPTFHTPLVTVARMESFDQHAQNSPRWLSSLLRGSNAKLAPGSRPEAVFVILMYAAWLRGVNEGDPIFHRTGRNVCLLGADAPEMALAHCLGHVYGLVDDIFGPPNPFSYTLRGYYPERDRVVNSGLSEELDNCCDFPLMSSGIGLADRQLWDDVWIDSGNYAKLIQRLSGIGGGATVMAVGESTEAMTVGGEVVLENGSETGLLDVTDLPARGTPFPAPEGGGDYSLQLLDGGGAVLATHDFTPDFFIPEEGVEQASFLFTVPAPDGIQEVKLLHNGVILSTVTASANAPMVEVTQPTGGSHSGTIEVSWSASDADPDADLSISVFYTQDDGVGWTPLELDTANDRYTLDTSDYSSCDHCRIKVVARDGFHVAEAESAPFSVSNPPQVNSVWPLNGEQDAAIYTQVTATFRDPMDAETIDSQAFTLTDEQGESVSGAVTYEPEGHRAVFVAEAALEYSHAYTATLAGTIADAWGQPLGDDYVWSFKVGASPFVPACIGDCNDDGAVTVDELIKGVNIALESLPPDACDAFDANADGAVIIDELLRAVNHALRGCPPARIRAALVEGDSAAPSGSERPAEQLAGFHSDLTAGQRS